MCINFTMKFVKPSERLFGLSAAAAVYFARFPLTAQYLAPMPCISLTALSAPVTLEDSNNGRTFQNWNF